MDETGKKTWPSLRQAVKSFKVSARQPLLSRVIKRSLGLSRKLSEDTIEHATAQDIAIEHVAGLYESTIGRLYELERTVADLKRQLEAGVASSTPRPKAKEA